MKRSQYFSLIYRALENVWCFRCAQEVSVANYNKHLTNVHLMKTVRQCIWCESYEWNKFDPAANYSHRFNCVSQFLLPCNRPKVRVKKPHNIPKKRHNRKRLFRQLYLQIQTHSANNVDDFKRFVLCQILQFQNI